MPVNVEGATTLDFGIDFNNSGTINTGTSVNTGAFLTSAGGVTVKSVDIKFGITANPSLTGTQTAADLANYPAITDANGYTYKPLFFYFKNGTATFTVGNSPVTVDFGRSLKTKFSDYVFDNDLNGRGDGYAVTINGSNLPIIGAFKPIIKAVYGSSNLTYDAAGANVHASTGANGDYRYYRGVRAEITPVGTLKLGLNYAEEAKDTRGPQVGRGRRARRDRLRRRCPRRRARLPDRQRIRHQHGDRHHHHRPPTPSAAPASSTPRPAALSARSGSMT